MKKYICTIFALLLSVLLMFTMAACVATGGKETPDASSSLTTTPTVPTEPPYMPADALELWNKVDGAMKALECSECTTEMKLVYYASGYQFQMDSTMYAFSGKDAQYIEANVKNVCADLELDQDIKTVSAYYDGKMYSAFLDGIYDQMLCSAATIEEYVSTTTGALTDELDFADCTGGKFTKNPDGTWTIEFSGYTNKTMNKVLDAMGMSGTNLGVPVEDMQVVIQANSEFLVETMSITMVFEEQEESVQPEYTITIRYDQYNEAVFDPSVLKAEEYTEVEDLFVLEMIEDALTERQNATSGNFVLDVSTTTRYYGQTIKNKETDTVTYGKKNGGYYYSIIADTDGGKMTIVYQNGMQTVNAGGEEYKSSITDADAKATVDSLINNALFESLSVTNIEKEGEGVYLLTCDAINLDTYSARVAASGIKLESGEQAIKITFVDGELVKIESLVLLKGKLEYDDVEFDLKSIVDFAKEADYPTI